MLALTSVRASHFGEHQHQISVPEYHPQLQNLGQHVDLPEIPTKVIRITKTVAIKVPVPYPVKVPYRVPYVVEVNKVKHVSVPKIIQVPQPYPVPVGHGYGGDQGGHGEGGYGGDHGVSSHGSDQGAYASHYSPSQSEYSEGSNNHAQATHYMLQVIPSQEAAGYSYQHLAAQQAAHDQQPDTGAQVQGVQYQQEQGSYGH